MKRQSIVWCCLWLIGLAGPAQAADKKDGSKAKVTLLPSVESIVPGVPFEIGVQFEQESGWHIYWQNSGDAGYAPRIEWKLPAGFTANEPQFPIPRRTTAPGDIVTNNLPGNPVLMVRITPPADVKPGKIDISAKVRYLICNVPCIEEDAQPAISLTVGEPGSEQKLANQQALNRARRALPKPSSEHLKVTPSIASTTLTAGSKFDLTLLLEVPPGKHIESNDPGPPTLFPTDVFTYRVGGIRMAKPIYPPAKVRKDPALGDVGEFEGKVTVAVSGEVDASRESGPAKIGGIVAFQACTTDGHCFPPEAVEFSVPVTIEGQSKANGNSAPAGQAGSSATKGSAERINSSNSASTTSTFSGSGESKSFLYWLSFAFLGGLILNIMPCVLPVISIKVLSFVQQAGESPGRVLRLGITFSAGILLSFEALAAVIVALKSAGHALGWGFQFQSPAFVIVMMTLMFVFGLSLLGVFIITLPGAAVTHLSAAEEHEGYVGAFTKGALGTIMATPCTAPFLGPALGVAFQSTNTELFAIFTAIGLGMSSPFLLLTAFPKWLRFLPRPGSWMEHFKQFMGFLLMGTVVWLMFTLGDEIGPKGLTRTMAFLVFIGLACWLLGRQTPLTPVARRLLAWVASLGIVVAGWWVCFQQTTTLENLMADVRLSKVCPCPEEVPQLTASDWEKGIPWQPWSKGRASMLASQGYTVYVDYTATWCATCLANKAATLETETVRHKMRDNCVVPLKADFTLNDPDILDDLQSFGRSGVPLNVIYPHSLQPSRNVSKSIE
ncbi:MAG: thioredoxin family protein [Planctomycetes bacterium]|nr:thioredoxin family protein [Planctomycetota bacterium]